MFFFFSDRIPESKRDLHILKLFLIYLYHKTGIAYSPSDGKRLLYGL